ncbi:MAG: hypothetical protein EPN22_15215 [Nitrospirae bacterium]|nr:MAG: hypothetical protein EPN22_15215 [Nitrospirota bacterium]
MGIRIFFAVFIFSVVFITHAFCAEQAKDGDEGRYQLFQGTYTTFDLKRQETYTHQAVFLIDTRTGKVKRYVNRIDVDGKYIETWVQTDAQQDKK